MTTPEAVRPVFLQSAEAAHALLADPRVGERWTEPSALARMPVGALAGHLARAVFTAADYLAAEPPAAQRTLSPAEYFNVLLSDRDLDSPLHTGVRARSEEAAAGGHAALVERFRDVLHRLQSQLQREPQDRRLSVAGGNAMLLDDYLVTRVVELAIHTDDLAVSIGLDAGPSPGTALAIDALVDAACGRHGPVAVLRALSRRERDTVEALRVI